MPVMATNSRQLLVNLRSRNSGSVLTPLLKYRGEKTTPRSARKNRDSHSKLPGRVPAQIYHSVRKIHWSLGLAGPGCTYHKADTEARACQPDDMDRRDVGCEERHPDDGPAPAQQESSAGEGTQ